MLEVEEDTGELIDLDIAEDGAEVMEERLKELLDEREVVAELEETFVDDCKVLVEVEVVFVDVVVDEGGITTAAGRLPFRVARAAA